jgi:hypothetical protein
MVLKHQKRCHCHRPRHKRSSAILACDVVLGIMAAIFIVFLLYTIILPRMGIAVNLDPFINAFYSGLWFVALLIAVNIGWAIYYGCHKSKAGVLLSIMTASIMVYTYTGM